MQPTGTVDRSVSRDWRRGGGHSVVVSVAGHPRTHGRSDLEGAVLSAARAADSVGSNGKAAYISHFWSDGTLQVAVRATRAQHLAAWCAALAAALTPLGWAPELRAARARRSPLERTDESVFALAAVLFFRPPVRSGPKNDPQSQAPWATDADLAHRLATWVDSATALDGSTAFLQRNVLTLPTANSFDAQFLLDPGPYETRFGRFAGLERARRVVFDISGHVVLLIRDDPREALNIVRALRQTLVDWADDLDYGCVRPASLKSLSAADALAFGYPRLPGHSAGLSQWGYFRSFRHLDPEYVPDAHAIQLLGPKHVARASDLRGWTSTPVGSRDMQIVEARQLEPWFAISPAEGVVERARAEFGDVVMPTSDKFNPGFS